MFRSGSATTVHRLHVNPSSRRAEPPDLITETAGFDHRTLYTCAQFGIPRPHICCSHAKKNSRHERVMYMALLADKPSTIQTCTRGHRFQFLQDVFRIWSRCKSKKQTLLSIQYCKMIGIELVTINLYPVH